MRSRLWCGFVVALALTAGAWLASEPVAAQALPGRPAGRPPFPACRTA